jgi:hypothetical protein
MDQKSQRVFINNYKGMIGSFVAPPRPHLPVNW